MYPDLSSSDRLYDLEAIKLQQPIIVNLQCYVISLLNCVQTDSSWVSTNWQKSYQIWFGTTLISGTEVEKLGLRLNAFINSKKSEGQISNFHFLISASVNGYYYFFV